MRDIECTRSGPSEADFRDFLDSLGAMDEQDFLDLCRNWLGEVQTPYRKPDLVHRLESLLRSPDFQGRCRNFLSLEDRHLLSALLILGSAQSQQLKAMVGQDLGAQAFHLRLLTLEDRLLVYRSPLAGGDYALNPILLPALRDLLSVQLVIPQDPAPRSPPQGKDLDLLLLAAASHFSGHQPGLKRSGEPRQRDLEHFLRVFAPYVQESALTADQGRLLFVLLHRGLVGLGLVLAGEGQLRLDLERWEEYAGLPGVQRHSLFLAAALWPEPVPGQSTPSTHEGWAGWQTLGRIVDYASSLGGFFRLAHHGIHYQREGLAALASASLPPRQGPGASDFLAALVVLGLLHMEGDQGQFVRPLDQPAAGQLRLEANSRLTLISAPGLERLTALCGFCRLESFGRTSQWVLDRDSFHQGLALGMSPGRFHEQLAHLGVPTLPQNIAFNLQQWLEDYESLRFVEGILVIARGQRQALLEKLTDLEPWVLERPAPGMVLLDRQGRSQWLEILRKAGLSTTRADLLGQGSSVLPMFASLDLEHLPARLFSEGQYCPGPPDHARPFLAIEGPGRQEIIRENRQRLATLDLAEDVRQEMEQRIREGIILLPGQVTPQTVRQERMEAGGLDYQGKKRVVEQVLRGRKDYLELTLARDGETFTLLVRPQGLAQGGKEPVLQARTIPEGREASVELRKILRVRRVRSGFFH